MSGTVAPSQRKTRVIAWTLIVVAVVFTGAELWLLVISPGGLPLNDPNRSALIDYTQQFFVVAVGGLIAIKRPLNLIGWLLLGYAASAGMLGFLAAYAERGAIIEPGSLPGAAAALWIVSWAWIVYIAIMPFILLYFPNGQLLSPRWRWVAWSCAVPGVMLLASGLTWIDETARRIYETFETDQVPGAPWTEPVVNAAIGLLLVIVLLSIASLVVRYRRGAIEERLQLKWVLFAAALLLVQGIFENFLTGPEHLMAALGAVAFAAVPAAMGIAVLKYRLYDIDRIINRALVYGVLTVALGAGYLLVVITLQGLLGTFTEANELAVAASTLVVAALFQPARTRVQGFIDRRFYRSRYNAARTLEAFSARLRDDIDLSVLTRDLMAVVGDTMRPAHISLWLPAEREVAHASQRSG